MNDLIFENEIAIVAIIKNESRYISEWLKYHYRIGVDKFYLYNNDSEDMEELERILEPWIQSKIVDLKNISGLCKQMPAYIDAIENHRFDCRYMAFIDIDEFVFVKNRKTLLGLLNEHFSKDPRIGGLAVNWKIFGSSGKKLYEPKDVIDRFTFRAADDYPLNNHIKTIADPRKIFFMQSPHNAVYILDCDCYDFSLHFVPLYSNENRDYSVVQINHYFTKSTEEYDQKIARGRADFRRDDRDKNLADDQSLNEVEDLDLKILYAQLKQNPLPPVKDHSEQKILENVSAMLKSKLDAEKILMCAVLIRKLSLLNEQEKLQLENYLLDLLAESKDLTSNEICILLANIAFLLRERKSLVDLYKKFLPKLMNGYELEVELTTAYRIRQIYQILLLM